VGRPDGQMLPAMQFGAVGGTWLTLVASAAHEPEKRNESAGKRGRNWHLADLPPGRSRCPLSGANQKRFARREPFRS
jgi:hypothetical protein